MSHAFRLVKDHKVMIMTKISYVCLLLLAYICFSRGEDPIKSVSCDVQGTLTATLTSDSPWTLPEKAICRHNQVTLKTTNTDTFTISGCGIGDGVVLVLTKTNPDTTPVGHVVVALSPKSETKTVTLTCNKITRDVTQVAKLGPWNIGEDPIQSVSCDVQGTLSVTITHGSPWTLPEKATCGHEQVIIKTRDTDTFTISGCAINTDVVLVLTKTNPDTTPAGHVVVALTPKSETKTVTLTCNKITRDVTRVAKLEPWSIGSVTDNPVTKNATESIHMLMELRETTGAKAIVTTISLNRNYNLLIAGAGTHATQVKGCTAAATDSSTDSVPIFPRGTPEVLEQFTSDNIQSKNINGKKVNQIATLTGFRLVGSNTVFLKCTINVCAQACPSQSPTTSQSNAERKRMSKKRKGGKHPSTVHYATLKLTVRDTLLGTSTNGATDTFQVGRKLVKFIVLITTIGFIY
ncbi:uncharacterized protein LOC110441224 [Mizuhopecten yessoensis]|uniref:ZP domain-containing protein n=1 Tax=Mizuhopecten yessoensis TaxID=6573 RepID=A0A210PK00_MIZYE|nr:uncharacterized protein LOC110441224 [Mizuhopecten yessoensis]OWF36736.1 hypothetical protein KP79_PYT02947 [Mizuhopecten yessoensis]